MSLYHNYCSKQLEPTWPRVNCSIIWYLFDIELSLLKFKTNKQMKKILAFLFGILVVMSCSTSSDDNGNSTTTVVPVPPTNLIGTAASPTQINLSWTDNSTNETGFKIQRRTGSESYAIVGNANTDILTFSDTGLTPSTTYVYRVYAYNAAGDSPTYSNEVTVTTTAIISLPTLTTTAASSIANTTAVSGGTISSDGGAAITVRGVCWSTSPNPTIALTTKTTDGAGIGVFTSSITGLTAGTTYYVRAYATNNVGTAYGNQVSFTSKSVLFSATEYVNSPWQIDWPVSIGGNYILKVSGVYGITSDGGIDVDAAYVLSNQTPYNQTCTGYQDRWLLVDNCPARPNPDIYNPNHIYYYYINNSDGMVNINYSDSEYSDNSGSLTFELSNAP